MAGTQEDELKAMFPSFLSGTLGCLKNVRVHLHLVPEVRPIRQKLRPLPFHLREAVSKEIKKQIELGILERVTYDMGRRGYSTALLVKST